MKSTYTARLSGINLNLDTSDYVTPGFRKYSEYITSERYKRRAPSTPSSDQVLLKVTEKLLDMSCRITPGFKKEFIFIPRRTLTHPKESSTNFGYDNINHDYILRVKEILGDEKKYEIVDLMGRGTFGQVVKCRMKPTGELVAIKVTKRERNFYKQSVQEIELLTKLNGLDKDKFLQLRDHFFFRGHNCAVLELLADSLYKYASSISQRPAFQMDQIKSISKQILETLSILKKINVIHADLKPDNILFKKKGDLYNVKLIDYGSALDKNAVLVYPVQSASFRAPEVILRLHYSTAIDMWSFGCLIAEMITGKNLFPSENEGALLHMMVALLRHPPPDHMLRNSQGSRYFTIKNSTTASQTRLNPITRTGHDIQVDRTSLEQRIMGPVSDDPTRSTKDKIARNQLVDFLKKILVFDPNQRLTPDDALKHPFITSEVIDDITSSSSPDNISTKALPNLIQESNKLNVPPREGSSGLVIEGSGISSITTTTSATIADSNRTLDTPATEIQEEIIPAKSKVLISPPPPLPPKQPKSILKTKPSNKDLSNGTVRFDSREDTTFLYEKQSVYSDELSSTYSIDRPNSTIPPTDIHNNINQLKAANYLYQQPRPSTVGPILNYSSNYMHKQVALNGYRSPPLNMVTKYQMLPQYHHPFIQN